MVALLILGMTAPLSAQNPDGILTSSLAHHPSDGSEMIELDDFPTAETAQENPSAEPPVFTPQDPITLNEKEKVSQHLESLANPDVLRRPSPLRNVIACHLGVSYEVATARLQSDLAEISAIYRESGKSEKSMDCETIALSVAHGIQLDPSRILEIVELEVGANPGCSCEIVKAAIKTREADVEQVVAIAEAAIHASPESMRLISQCAIASHPDALAGVQALLAKLDPGAGESGSSSKSSKSAKGAKNAKSFPIVAPPLPNPLDRLLHFPLLTPLPIFPTPVTEVNPGAPG